MQDYRINVFEIAYLTPEQVKLFQSDFRIVADYFVQKRLNHEYKPSPQKMKHVQVGEVLANQKGGVYLKIILSQWYGLDGQGKVVASAEDKKAVGNTDISLYVEGVRTIYGSLVKNKPDGMHGSMDEMKLEAKEWSLPGFKIVVDEEWTDYVRPDVNFVMSEGGDA